MGRVQYSSVIADISGSVGSVTFQRNSYGSTIRNKPISLKASTDKQQYIRSRMSLISQAWRSLSPELQKQFNNFFYFSKDTAWLNKNSALSGYNLFTKWYFYILQCGLTLPSAIVFKSLNRVVLAPYFRLVSGHLYLFPYPSESIETCRVAVYISGFYQFANQGAFKPQKYIATIDLAAGSYLLTAQYLATYGQLPFESSFIDVSLVVFATDAPIIFTEQLFHCEVYP